MYVPTNPHHDLECISYILLTLAIIFFLWDHYRKNRLYHMLSALFFVASIVYAILFYLQDLHYIFSTQNMEIAVSFILQQNGSLFLSFVVMSLFALFSVLIDYNILTISETMRKGLWLGVCILAISGSWYHIWQHTPLGFGIAMDTALLLHLAPSLENYMLFSLIYFCLMEGGYCNKRKL